MCEFSCKLMAWLDCELTAEDAADVECHLELCDECRGRVEAYRQAATAFDQYCDAYCDAVMASPPSRKPRRRVLKLWEAAALAAAATAALLLLAVRTHVQRLPMRAPEPLASTPIVSQTIEPQPIETTPAARTTPTTAARPRRSEHATPVAPRTSDGNEFASEPALEITIPADAILPPGAVPEGVSFAADVTIAPDGSAQQIRLQPQLTEFERRTRR